jgi:transposase-like protein
MNTNYDAFTCPYDGSDASMIVSKGARHNKSGRVQVFMCKRCGRKFSSTQGFSKARHDPFLIVAAIDLYLTGLSTRQVQQHLEMMYGCEVTAMTVYNWVRRYTRLIANYAKTLQPRVGGQWHADEMNVKTRRAQAYLWNVLDRRSRFLLISALTRGRGEREAARILKGAFRFANKKPSRIVTDALASYRQPVKSLKVRQHVFGPRFSNPRNNNVIERLHGTLRTRYDRLGRLGGVRSGGGLAEGVWLNYNFIRPHLGLAGKTPAEAAGIGAKGRNKWHSLIVAARRKRQRKDNHKRLGRRARFTH